MDSPQLMRWILSLSSRFHRAPRRSSKDGPCVVGATFETLMLKSFGSDRCPKGGLNPFNGIPPFPGLGSLTPSVYEA